MANEILTKEFWTSVGPLTNYWWQVSLQITDNIMLNWNIIKHCIIENCSIRNRYFFFISFLCVNIPVNNFRSYQDRLLLFVYITNQHFWENTVSWSRTIYTTGRFRTSNLSLVYMSTTSPSEPRREKTGLRGFRPGPTQTGLYKLRKELEAWNFGFK